MAVGIRTSEPGPFYDVHKMATLEDDSSLLPLAPMAVHVRTSEPPRRFEPLRCLGDLIGEPRNKPSSLSFGLTWSILGLGLGKTSKATACKESKLGFVRLGRHNLQANPMAQYPFLGEYEKASGAAGATRETGDSRCAPRAFSSASRPFSQLASSTLGSSGSKVLGSCPYLEMCSPLENKVLTAFNICMCRILAPKAAACAVRAAECISTCKAPHLMQ